MPRQGRACAWPSAKKVDADNQLQTTVAGLNRLARNLWWTWNQEAQDVFEELSPRAWRNLYHNAVAVLRELSEEELRVRLLDEEFNARVQAVLRQFKAYLGATDTWAEAHAPRVAKRPVVATGGCAALMASQLSMVRHVEPLLTLEGLRWAGLAHRPAWWRT